MSSKRVESKFKINRRLGVNLWGRAKSPLNKRDYGPGQHGQRRKKPSDFGTQLMAKQKLKGYYGNISERQFRRAFMEARRRKGDTAENLIALLERRLDAVVYRMKFAISPFASRMPYEMMLIPRTPRTRFQDDGPVGARLLHEALYGGWPDDDQEG